MHFYNNIFHFFKLVLFHNINAIKLVSFQKPKTLFKIYTQIIINNTLIYLNCLIIDLLYLWFELSKTTLFMKS